MDCNFFFWKGALIALKLSSHHWHRYIFTLAMQLYEIFKLDAGYQIC